MLVLADGQLGGSGGTCGQAAKRPLDHIPLLPPQLPTRALPTA